MTSLRAFWMRARGGLAVTHSVSAHANPGRPVSREAFDHIAGIICDAAAEAHRPRWTASFLSLHGPWSPPSARMARASLLRRLRAIVGPDLPIAATLDLHAMVTPRWSNRRRSCVSYKTYPHVDMRITGRHAARRIWSGRRNVVNDFMAVEAAAAIAKAHSGDRPLLVADYADNPGAGAYGDATNLLKALLDAGVTNASFSPMIDPEAAAELHRHRVGDRVTLAVGGKCDPQFGGGPLTLTGEIRLLSDGAFTGDGPIMGGVSHTFGPTAVFRVHGIDILIVTENEQMLDQQQLRAFGIDPEKKAVLALKSMQHFRAAFEPIASRTIVCDSGALATPQAAKRPYKRVRRPVWPLDPEMEFQRQG
jgi:microcystin degradation protein MlrC